VIKAMEKKMSTSVIIFGSVFPRAPVIAKAVEVTNHQSLASMEDAIMLLSP
jgi:hypothetical protein